MRHSILKGAVKHGSNLSQSDDRTRQLMLDEMDYDIAPISCISAIPEWAGSARLCQLIAQAIQRGNDETLAKTCERIDASPERAPA